jgi:hypothetical protein
MLALTVVLGAATPAAAQTLEAGALQVRFTGRVQFQYNTSSVPGQSGTFEMRRARQAVRLTIDDWIQGHLEADFALGRLALKSAFMELAASPGINLRFGQYKMPFGLFQPTSSTQTLTIERGLRIRGLDAQLADEDAGPGPVLTELDGTLLMGEEQALLDTHGYHGYDMGAQVHGTAGRLGYAVGLFNGSGPDRRDANESKTVAGRFTYALGGQDAPLVLGAAAVFKDREDGFGQTQRGQAFELDAEYGAFRRPGLHVQAELVTGENMAVDETFIGAQGVAAWFAPLEGPRVEGWELVGRASWGDPSTDRADDAGMLLTPGLNLYFHGRNRLMANWDVFVPQAERFETRHALRLQTQLHY